eukprot:7573960-Prorocentrum_lima.AAC.1
MPQSDAGQIDRYLLLCTLLYSISPTSAISASSACSRRTRSISSLDSPSCMPALGWAFLFHSR